MERSYTASKARDAAPKNKADPMSMQANGWTMPTAGRNLRSVWQIATEPFPEAHFATYPQELVRRCILAGTSERGECAECGAPWRRQVERTAMVIDRSERTHPLGHTRSSGTMLEPPTATTTGWEQSCDCRAKVNTWLQADTRPQLVLDPFIGSGTTALVARKHGRRSIGIDLSAEYLAIAARRTQQLSLLGGVEESPRLRAHRGLTGGAYSPPGQSPHSNARDGAA